jgi:hypothetical protein
VNLAAHPLSSASSVLLHRCELVLLVCIVYYNMSVLPLSDSKLCFKSYVEKVILKLFLNFLAVVTTASSIKRLHLFVSWEHVVKFSIDSCCELQKKQLRLLK